MLDIVPSSGPSRLPSEPGIPPRRRIQVAPRPHPAKPREENNKPKVVEIAWRLPARLRRPVREEIRRQRRRNQRREAIVHFERRPLYTELPSQYPDYGNPEQRSAEPRGAEHHTGDVYMHSRPEVRLTLPPYTGRFARFAHRPRTAPPVAPPKVEVMGGRPLAAPRLKRAKPAHMTRGFARGPYRRPMSSKVPSMPVSQQREPSRKIVRPSEQRLPNRQARRVPVRAAGSMAGERDIPFDWQSVSPAQLEQPPVKPAALELKARSGIVAPPKRRFALPLHFSIFPRSTKPAPSEPDDVTVISRGDPTSPRLRGVLSTSSTARPGSREKLIESKKKLQVEKRPRAYLDL